MSKRVYRPQFGYENDMRVNVPTVTIIEPEPLNQFSGLLDANGNKLMVTMESEPAGFVIFKATCR